jgi:DNA primase
VTAEQIVRRHGKNIREKNDGWLMCCLYPEHRDSTPSFSVRLDGVFFCWGCGKHGNLSTLLHDIEGWSWAKAIAYAKSNESCTPRPELMTPEWVKANGNVERVISRGLLGLYAVDWHEGYKKYRVESAKGTTDFPAWCFPFLKGFTPDTLVHFDAGYDTSFQRVTIPIHNLRSQLVGFIGRTCIGDDQKYMVYPPLMPSHHVYGLDRVVRTGYRGTVVIVEGPWDVWFLHQIDPTLQAVAVMTSRIQDAQINQLVKAHKSYVILFDADGAGKKGAMQVASTLVDRGCRIDIARSTHEDVKQLTREDIRSILEKRQPFPAMDLIGLPQKARRRWQA